MRLITALITLILLTSIVSAESWIHQSQELEIDLDISSEIELTSSESSYSVDYVRINLLFYPKSTQQQTVLRLNTQPEANEEEGLIYQWDEPELGKLKFNLDSTIKTKNTIPKIYNKIKFPIEVPEELKKYTLATGFIDSDNPEIIKLASELAQGEDDLYVVVFKLGQWVDNNINYSLNTLTEEVVQSSSWVLTNRYGVCDEITNIFIALSRSLGIPAKYISGIAYTNWENANDWGNHAWAEVYFPNQGWVPFDITYGEFGFVDASHIVLKESLDSDESSVKYQWKGRNIELETQKLDINAKLKKQTGKITAPIKLEIAPLKESIGFGSYNLVQATIKNIESYYVVTRLSLAKSPEVNIINSINQHVLLKPQEKKNVFWIIKIDENLKQNYEYTLPIAVFSTRNVSASSSFASSSKYTIYSKQEIETILEQNKEETKKVYSKKVELNCVSNKQKLYLKETAKIECTIENKGNTLLEDLNICLDKTCRLIDLGISQEENIDFTFKPEKIGQQDKIITAKNLEITKSTTLAFDVLDKPGIIITNIEAPKEVEFKQEYIISFKLDKTSFSSPKNLKVKLIQDKFEEQWEIKELANDRTIKINMIANDLKQGKNKFTILVEYEDDRANNHEAKNEFSINLENVTFWQNMQIFFNRLGRKLESIF